MLFVYLLMGDRGSIIEVGVGFRAEDTLFLN
jgi:hypothetical protein